MVFSSGKATLTSVSMGSRSVTSVTSYCTEPATNFPRWHADSARKSMKYSIYCHTGCLKTSNFVPGFIQRASTNGFLPVAALPVLCVEHSFEYYISMYFKSKTTSEVILHYLIETKILPLFGQNKISGSLDISNITPHQKN